MFEEESEIYNLFISQLNEKNEEYDRFIGKLEASSDFQWKNHTIADKTRYKRFKRTDKTG